MKNARKSLLSIILFLGVLVGCSTSDTQPTSDEIKNIHGDITNFERLGTFVDNFNKGIKDEVRITSSTIEGDPLSTVVTYDGDHVEVFFDNSKDRYGSGETLLVRCSKIFKKPDTEYPTYAVSGCSGGEAPPSFDLISKKH